MSGPELLPCPFCAKSLRWSELYKEYDHPPAKCILSGRTFQKGFVGQWNTRAPLSPAVLAALPEVRDLLRRAYAAGWDAYHAQDQADWTDTRGVEATREADLDAIAAAIREGRT